VLSRSGGFSELRCESLDPPVHGDVIDLDPSLGEKLLDVSVGEAEPQVPSDRQGDDVRREAVPGEDRPGALGASGVDGCESEISWSKSPRRDASAANATVPTIAAC